MLSRISRGVRRRSPFVRLSSSPIRRGAAYVVAGTALAQLIALAITPVIARLYTPRDYGLYAVVSAIAVTIGTIGALRLEFAVPLPPDESDAQSLVAMGLLSTVVVAAGASIAVAVWGDSLGNVLSEPAITPLLWFVPGCGALISSYLLFSQLAIRHRSYRDLGRRNVLQGAILSGAQLVAGTAGLRSVGLIFGFGLGQAAGTLSLIRGARLWSKETGSGWDYSSMRAVLSRYRRFPLVLAPAGLLNVVGIQLPILLMAYYYGGQVAGWFGLTQRVLAVPVSLVGVAAAQVYLGEFSQAVRGNVHGADQLFRRGTRILLMLSAALLVGTLLFSPWAFSLVFGSEWRESGRYAQALSIGLAAQLIGSPLSQTLTVLEREGLQLAWDALRVISIAPSVAAAASAGASPFVAVWVVGGVSAILYIVAWLLSHLALRSFLRTRGF